MGKPLQKETLISLRHIPGPYASYSAGAHELHKKFAKHGSVQSETTTLAYIYIYIHTDKKLIVFTALAITFESGVGSWGRYQIYIYMYVYISNLSCNIDICKMQGFLMLLNSNQSKS